jgi:tetratricopeptide (TPR) repeat protein
MDPGQIEPVVDLPIPTFAGWRFALAGIYGLVAALALGFLWYLVSTATSTRFGLAALLLGFAVGSVVSIMGGGNRDKRFALLGAILAGTGVAFGEFLIFGLPGSAAIYEFGFIDLVIYGLALFEGWIIPLLSMPMARKGSQWIHEGNWNGLLIAGSAALMVILGLSAVMGLLPSRETRTKIHYDRGFALFTLGRTGEAIAEYQQAIEVMPEYAAAHTELGAIYCGLGRLADAEAELEMAIEYDSDQAAAHAWLANVYDHEGRYREGLAEVEIALELDPSLALAHLVSGYLNASLGRDTRALSAIETALGLDPSLSEAHLMLGILHNRRSDWDSAIRSLSQALDMQSGPEDQSVVLIFRGLAHAGNSDYENAITDLNEAVGLDGDSPYGYYYRGTVYSEMGNQEEARADLEAALMLGLEPDYAKEARTMLGELGP